MSRISAWLFAVAVGLGVLSGAYADEPKFCSQGGSVVPPDTLSSANPDGSLTLHAPAGWSFLVNHEQVWVRSPAASITCSCSDPAGSGGCSPGVFGGKAGCVMTTCNACSKSGANVFYAFKDAHEGVAFATREEVAKLPSVNRELLQIPEVARSLSQFRHKLGISDDARADRQVMVRIYGHIAALEVPDGARLPDAGSATGNAAMGLMASQLVVSTNASPITCKCNVQGKSCPKDSMLGVTWCDASNCESCTMSGY